MRAAMDRTGAPALADAVAATLDWWRLAGVDQVFSDTPEAWLTEPEPESEPERQTAMAGRAAVPRGPGGAAQANEKIAKTAGTQSPAAKEPDRPRIGGERGGWPQDLASFRDWWLTEPSLGPESQTDPRVAPIGDHGAALMVLVPMPEQGDRDRLLNGPQGRLIAAMARAMGIGHEQLYLASALPSCVTFPDWADLDRDGMGAVLRHHVALVAPVRLLVLGPHVASLLQGGSAPPSPDSTEIDVGGRALPVLVDCAPAALLGHAGLRKSLWRNWLDWTSQGPGCADRAEQDGSGTGSPPPDRARHEG